LSASSPDTSGKADGGVPSASNDNPVPFGNANISIAEGVRSQSRTNNRSAGYDYLAATPEGESGYGGSGKMICSQCRKRNCQCETNVKEVPSFSRHQNIQYSTVKNPISNSISTIHDLIGGEVFTDSSFASVTDFEDVSFSSDWVSAEDLRSGRVTSRGHRGMSKMHKEMAEIKCTNTILENELIILKNRNSDFHAQLQKLAGKNNSLKQKICDRSLAIKKAEREMAVMAEEKMRLEIQVSATKEELTRVERERAKLERSLSSSKSENKRLKNDLAMVRAESYKTMKTLIKLESENNKLQSELDESREQLKSTRELTVNTSTGSLTSLEDHQSRIRNSSESHNVASKQAVITPPNEAGSCREKALDDRTGLSLELTNNKSGVVRRVSSDQSFPRYHYKGKDLISSSVSSFGNWYSNHRRTVNLLIFVV
jgi:hypothetical protein